MDSKFSSGDFKGNTLAFSHCTVDIESWQQSIYIWWPTHIDVRTRMYKKHWWFERVIECQTWVTVSKQSSILPMTHELNDSGVRSCPRYNIKNVPQNTWPFTYTGYVHASVDRTKSIEECRRRVSPLQLIGQTVKPFTDMNRNSTQWGPDILQSLPFTLRRVHNTRSFVLRWPADGRHTYKFCYENHVFLLTAH